jgi:hypothetical protein
MPDVAAMIDSIKREIALRERCYPKWVAAGRMRQAEARRELDTMAAVLRLLLLVKAWSESPWQEPQRPEALALYRAALGLPEQGDG